MIKCLFFLLAPVLTFLIAPSFAAHATVIMDGEFDDWVGISGQKVKAVGDKERLYFYFSLSNNVVLQDRSGVEIFFDTDEKEATGLKVHGIGADYRWDAGLRSGVRFSTHGIVNGAMGISSFDVRALPVFDNSEFELCFARGQLTNPVPRPELVPAGCTIAVVYNGVLIGTASAKYSNTVSQRQAMKDRSPYADLRLVAYNVERDSFLTDAARQKIYLAELEQLQPDVICFTEIYNHSAEQTRAVVAQALPYMAYAGGDGSTDGRVVSRYPVEWVAGAGRFHAVRLQDVDEGIDLLFLTAHLSCCSNSPARAAQMKDMGDLINEVRRGNIAEVPTDIPVVVSGDLNLVRNDNENFRAFQDVGGLKLLRPLHLDQFETYTWRDDSSGYSAGILDYILHSSGVIALRKFVFRSVVPPSDHLPMVADIAIDTDGNGLADRWEASYFSSNPIAEEDADGDGFTNLEEQGLGTSPIDGMSKPALEMLTANGLTLHFRNASAESRFSLSRSEDLVDWVSVPGRWTGQSLLPMSTLKPATFFRATLEE